MSSPHSNWSHYDEGLEMASLDAMHSKLAAGDFDVAAEAKALRDLAGGYGYGEANSHLADRAGKDPDTETAAVERKAYDSFAEGDYFDCVDGSENRFLEAFGHGPALEVARSALQGMRDEFEAGRARREAMEEAASPSP